jgi:hypothetical protein
MMAQTDFSYGAVANDQHGLRLGVSIFADREHVRDVIREDAAAAGLEISDCAPLGDMGDRGMRPLGEVILIDCPLLEPADAAALSLLDMRAAQSGAHLVISTSVAALDDVFGCCDQSNPQILVDPSRAERVIALGRVLARLPRLRLRELSEEDRLTLLRLTEQVGQIAERLERIGRSENIGEGGVFRFESPSPSFHAAPVGEEGDRLVRATRPPLPDPRLVRRIIRQRQLRARFFDGDLFADPAWDMLLDLTAARVEHTRVSVTSLCIASGVPPTTALRWISQMSEAGLLERVEDETDRRRAFIALSDRASDAMARYFSELGKASAQMV